MKARTKRRLEKKYKIKLDKAQCENIGMLSNREKLSIDAIVEKYFFSYVDKYILNAIAGKKGEKNEL